MEVKIDKVLYHITPQDNKQSILDNGLIRGDHAFICLCKNPNNWNGLVNNSIIFEIDIRAYIKAYPHITITTWLPQSDEICVWGDIPKEYINIKAESEK